MSDESPEAQFLRPRACRGMMNIEEHSLCSARVIVSLSPCGTTFKPTKRKTRRRQLSNLENTVRKVCKEGRCAPSRVNAPRTYSVSSAKKGDESDIEWRKDKGVSVSRSRSSVGSEKPLNPPDKTSSPIDRQEGSIGEGSVGCEIIFKLSLIESAGEKKNYAFNQQSCLRSKLRGKAQMRPSIQAEGGRRAYAKEGFSLKETQNFTEQRRR